MDDLKCKKTNFDVKKKDLLMKLQNKVKRKRKSKRKENFKTLKDVPKEWKRSSRNVLVGLGDKEKLLFKDRKGLEGMFSKGLRSKYISRESLNEANEARKKEDLNKIIGFGRVFLEKGAGRSSVQGLGTDGKLNGKEELEKFSFKYEETVGREVLRRLPGSGILEDALEGLRQIQTPGQDEPENGQSAEGDTTILRDFDFLAQDLGEGSGAEKTFENLISTTTKPGFPVLLSGSENPSESFVDSPWKNWLIMSDGEMENYNHPSFTLGFDIDEECKSSNLFSVQGEDFGNKTKDLSIATPPIQYYRRNMF